MSSFFFRTLNLMSFTGLPVSQQEDISPRKLNFLLISRGYYSTHVRIETCLVKNAYGMTQDFEFFFKILQNLSKGNILR